MILKTASTIRNVNFPRWVTHYYLIKKYKQHRPTFKEINIETLKWQKGHQLRLLLLYICYTK